MKQKLKHKNQGRRNEKRARGGGQTLLKGTDKILIMLKSIPWNLEGQLHSSILTDHILSIAIVITLDISTSQISSIDSGTAGFIITKGTLKTYCCIIFFILEGHFCPLAPPSKRQGG